MKARFVAAALFLLCLLGFCASTNASKAFFRPSLTVSEEYTDNLFLTEEDQEPEFLTVVSPRAGFSVGAQRSAWELSYAPGFTFYDQHEELNTVRHSASLSGKHQLSQHLNLTLADRFNRTEEPSRRLDYTMGNQDSEEPIPLEERIDYTIRTSREPRYTNDALARLNYRFGAEDRVYAAFNNRIFQDENPEGEDSERYTPSAGFEYWLDSKNGLQGDVSYTRGFFEEQTDDLHNVEGDLRYSHRFDRFLTGFTEYAHLYSGFDDSDDDYHVYNPSAGARYTFARDANLELSLGYFIQERKEGDNESGVTANLDVDKDWSNRRWAFRLSGSSGYEQTYFGSENLGFTQFYQARGALEYSFTKYLRSSLRADYRYSKYLDVDPEREDHVASANGGLTYQATQWMTLSLSDTYRIVDSGKEFGDYQENRVVLSVTVAPGPFALWK
jgi:hypothetical protein